MAWFRLDDKFHSNAKVMAAGNAAIGLYARCGTWTADHEKEGLIPHFVARSFGTKKEIATLLETRLWVEVEEGYKMPDYLRFNLSNEEVADRRSKRADAGRRGGIKSGESRRERSNDEANASGLLEAEPKQTRTESNPYPSLPDPDEQVSLQPKSVTREPDGGEGISRINAIADDYVRLTIDGMEQRGEPIKAPAGLKRHLRAKALENPDLERWADMFPTAPPDAVAAWLLGDKGSMRYFPRADELASAADDPVDADVIAFRPRGETA